MKFVHKGLVNYGLGKTPKKKKEIHVGLTRHPLMAMCVSLQNQPIRPICSLVSNAQHNNFAEQQSEMCQQVFLQRKPHHFFFKIKLFPIFSFRFWLN